MVLVFGGAGYVGSHVAKLLRKQGVEHAVVDNLENGHRQAVSDSRFIQADMRDPASLQSALKDGADAVMIFSGYISVGESYRNPRKYYENNIIGCLNLLHAAIQAGVTKVIFSSTAAVYGEPSVLPIPEEHLKLPTNPYGETKLAIERALEWNAKALGLRSVSLRYFNAAGADAEGELGEDHDPEEHLIPIAIDATLGRRQPMTIFGDDYPTDDGTCLRDYVHVDDLAQAHLLALNHVQNAEGASAFNLGSGTGFSVRQVVSVVSEVAQKQVPYSVGERRSGDPAKLVASNELAKRTLGWAPQYNDLKTIVQHAHAWRIAHPTGYSS